ncbi:MAG TPA: acetyl-CoA carboxylase biotin carboxylase subunit [Phycisphaerae bacterium]
MFKRILIANRGEIALRIIRACKELGVQTACVYSEADRGASYLRLADRTVCIGAPPPSESYLKSDRIIAAAEITNADAIHPGYGFLAENAQFAEKCRASRIEFIGPSAEAMRALGDKAQARELAKRAKVPIVPGSNGTIDDDAEALRVAKSIGLPIIIKAAAGGGGRGMRIVRELDKLKPAIAQARQEAMIAFKDASIYIEKFIEQPRHVEVQILADQHDNIIHLFERDCSTQRRHQKLIEESPSPAIDERTRLALCKSAVRLAEAAEYTNAGTVEFIVDAKGNYFFIEVNARIQVEHPVTEMITGIDLIKKQIAIAAGETLGLSQRQVERHGAAIECRINAEDPEQDFRPCAGRVELFRPPGGPGVRIDSHVHDGYDISPRYDSLIGKLIVHRPTRDEAIAGMRRCLDEFIVEPTHTTIPLYKQILHHDVFVKGKIDTGFVERTFRMQG